MNIETSVSPVVEPGLAADTASQASVPSEQSAGEKQEQSSTPAQVESKETPQPQAIDEPRARPSDFYRNRKLERELREIKQTMTGLMQNINQRQTQPDPSIQLNDPFKVSDKEFFADPVGIIRKVVETVTNQSLSKSVPEILTKQTQERELESKLQAAGEYISSKDFFKKDPYAKEKIEDILADPEHGLSEYQFINPMAAARLAERIYIEKYAQTPSEKRNTIVPSKAQLTSVATGGTAQGNPNPAEEFVRMGKEIEANPQIVFDPDFKKRFDDARTRYNSKLIQ